MNIRIDIEYDGKEFYGWQHQPGLPTVQSAIELAIQRICGKKAGLTGAGRTDRGVHALQQVANFNVDEGMSPEKWQSALNALLPPTVRVIKAQKVRESFNARRDATSKVYEYRIKNGRVASALDQRVYHYGHQVDWRRIQKALPYFIGEMDFRCFQGAKATVKTTIRRIYRFELFEEPEGVYRFEVEGSGFLKQMVRAMVGTLLEVGEGKRDPEEIPEIIAAGDRRGAGRTVPPEGLFLKQVSYPCET